MKKFIVILGILISISPCFGATQYSSILDNIENSLYGFTYTTSDDATRLARIEQTVYGQAKSNKSISDRVSSLKKDMSADLIGHEITPKEDTFMEEDDIYKEEKLAQNSVPPAGANVDYPSINELEKEIFKQEFKTKDLNSRLASLEQKSLGKTYENEPFSARVERLQAKIKPKSFMNNSIAQSSNGFYDEDVVQLDKNYKLDEYQPPEFDYDAYNSRNAKPTNLATVEKAIFKRTFANDNMDNRLSRLESTMFGTTFATDSENDRLRRISSAYKATKSASKYDSNKFSQNMATAMQIGTLLLMILACVL